MNEPLTPEGGSVNALDAEHEMLAAVYKLQEVAPAFLPENTELALLDDSDNPRPVESTGPEEFIQEEPDAAIPGWFVEIPLEDRGCALLALEMVPAIESLVDKEKKKDVVRQFVQMVKENISPEVAARRLKKKLPARPYIQKVVSELSRDFAWTADVDRHIVRTGRRKAALDAIEAGDTKLTLAALDAIASDPEVGLKAPPVTNINVNMGNLGAVFEAVEKDDYQVIDIGAEEGK